VKAAEGRFSKGSYSPRTVLKLSLIPPRWPGRRCRRQLVLRQKSYAGQDNTPLPHSRGHAVDLRALGCKPGSRTSLFS